MKRIWHNPLSTDARLMLWPLSAMVLLWTVVPVLVHTAPPLDVVESAMWGREWVVGTYKHPAMPAWFIEAGRVLDGGAVGWPAYFASQLFNLATLLLTFAAGRDLVNARVGAAAALSLLGVEYFSWRSVEFNHTIAQMPFWIGAVWCAWRASRQSGTGWYAALGIVAALGLYAKLSNATLLIVIGLWFLASQDGRRALKMPGPWVALIAFGVCVAPLVHWLDATKFAALDYASARGHEQSLVATLLFPANALLQAAPIVVVLAIAGVFVRGDGSSPRALLGKSKTEFLLFMAFGAPLLSIAMALVGGAGLRVSWLAPTFPLLTILALAHLEERLSDRVMKRLGAVAMVIAVALPAAYAVIVPLAGGFGSKNVLRVNWPQKDIAKALSAAWTAETGKPLKIVAGVAWIGGLVGIDHPDRPSILTEGELKFSPWITSERLRRDGALAVWIEGRGSTAMPALDRLVAGRDVKEVRMPFPRAATSGPLVIKYVVLKPE